MMIYANAFGPDLLFDFIEYQLSFLFLIFIYFDDIRHYSTLYPTTRIQTNCEIAITVIGVLKCAWEGGGRDVQRKGMEGA